MTDPAKLRLLAAILPALLLAGCGGSKKDKDDQRTASGEVLEGTISDAMLPLATVTSQPPRLRELPSDKADGEEGDGDDTPGDAPPIADEGAGAN